MITKQELKARLKKETLNIKFKKINGTERLMRCTLNPDLILGQEPYNESKEKTQNRKESEQSLVVWDLEKKSFRSFRIESVINCSSFSDGYEL